MHQTGLHARLILLFTLILGWTTSFAQETRSAGAIELAKELVWKTSSGIYKVMAKNNFSTDEHPRYTVYSGSYFADGDAPRELIQGDFLTLCSKSQGAIYVYNNTSFCLNGDDLLFSFRVSERDEFDRAMGKFYIRLNMTVTAPKGPSLPEYLAAAGLPSPEQRKSIEDEKKAEEAMKVERKRQLEAMEIARKEAEEKFRRSLKPGMRAELSMPDRLGVVSLCHGLVVEVRPPLAQLQYDNCRFNESSLRWVEIGLLAPEE